MPGLGAHYDHKICETIFEVWAPSARQVRVELAAGSNKYELNRAPDGYFKGQFSIQPGAEYYYTLDHQARRPDPASRYQPHGVHGPSAVVDQSYPWQDQSWRGVAWDQLVIYELHVGTFTSPGTLTAIILHLDELVELGITALELMPIAQFPGTRNWGYDGVCPFAVQNSYGGPAALKQLVDACHQRGLAVLLDVVYNHVGPEGNYLAEFGPYFSDEFRTPWGAAMNFTGPYSDAVRRFCIENALYWLNDCHLDGLRLDSVHAIYDQSARPFLAELSHAVQEFAKASGRRLHLIAESNQNDPRLVQPVEQNGMGLNGMWNDDYHHALHARLTGECDGYYAGFGEVHHLATALQEGLVYRGEYCPYRQRRHGQPLGRVPVKRLINSAQTHDQIGNRMLGERLTTLVEPAALRLAAAVTLLGPATPMLFMGEEYGETAPFQFFINHSDRQLIEAVRNGRKQEFAAFAWKGVTPDPQSESTFQNSRLNQTLKQQSHHRAIWELYHRCLTLRRELQPHIYEPAAQRKIMEYPNGLIVLEYQWVNQRAAMIINFNNWEIESPQPPMPAGKWNKRLDTADPQWGGTGSSYGEQLLTSDQTPWCLSPWQVLLLTPTATDE
ncbi:MAG: Malto-oligosyltrehalose trehalohydrolase [Phycisphaerae bacterium]|nr:Malto-oligosyltrehalose trehalohydrolase [Phycisphaerae bacterium]